MKKLKILIVTMFSVVSILGQDYLKYTDENKHVSVGEFLEIFEDKEQKYTIEEVLNKEFRKSNNSVPNLGISKSSFWLRFKVENKTNDPRLMVELSLATIDKVSFIYEKNGNWKTIKSGEDYPFYDRKYKDPNYIFDCYVPVDSIKTFYFKVSTSEGLQLPIILGTSKAINSQIKNRDVLSGIYFGLMLVIIIYNFFIYLSVRDKSYIYYVVYVILILLTQTSVQGYTFQYLWPNSPVFAKYSLFIFPSLVGIASISFMNVFLKVNHFYSGLYKISFYLFIPYIISIALAIFKQFNLSFILMEMNAMVVSIFMLYTAAMIVKSKYSPSKYFLIAWIIFLLGVVIYILKDLEILPFNNFTRYTMQIGSAIETVLLSFALAARINIYKRQRLEVLKINEKIIREQNTMLERKVKERTVELNQTLNDLKSTQSQLVEAEKMSSLGQLTAGIAHEINNPINFVSSNIYPLRQDIKDIKEVISKYEELEVTENFNEKLDEVRKLKIELDYDYLKEELDTIVDGIEEGALRTAEIVSGLRTFSRLDEGSLKDVNINEGIESTLVLVNSKLNGVKINKVLGDIPEVECNPGKINQLFMNLIDNAIFAVQKKNVSNEEGYVSITTDRLSDDKVRIVIEDNGIGIPDEIKDKLFDPFFTTKAVGEGTGLGMSIVRSIIDEHSGSINVDSVLNEGTKIEIVLPQKKKMNE